MLSPWTCEACTISATVQRTQEKGDSKSILLSGDREPLRLAKEPDPTICTRSPAPLPFQVDTDRDRPLGLPRQTLAKEIEASNRSRYIRAMPATPSLRSAISDAIQELLHFDGEEKTSELEESARDTAERLLEDALVSGEIQSAEVADLRSFSAGNSSMMVARLESNLSFVVKIDRNPDVVAEAEVLRRAAGDPSLPEDTRNAFPRIYAIDRIGPIFGYLMEDLSQYTSLHMTISKPDSDVINGLLADLWSSLLEPAYRATRTTRLTPNVAEDYFRRAERRLSLVVNQGVLPSPSESLVVDCGDEVLELRDGWGRQLELGIQALHAVQPTFATFVHGDPNPENVLWTEDNGRRSFRLLDPKNWWIGDYLFDVAKLTHYAKVTSPVEYRGVQAKQSSDAGKTTITYDRAHLAPDGMESQFLEVVRAFAESDEVRDPYWRPRYHLGVAGNLLSVAGARLAKGQEHIGLISFAEGLRELERILTDLGTDATR